MKLNSDQLNAFFEVAKRKSFSKAAIALALSQPALSLRIKKLEQQLKTSLFIRDNSTVSLTDAGEKLLLHCQLRENIEQEVLYDIGIKNVQDRDSIQGVVRIAGFSTTMRSVLIPSLHTLILKYPQIQLEAFIREMHELPGVLKRTEADFAISEGPIVLGSVENILIGYEENVVIESKKIIPGREDVYLDNDSEDQATFNFFKAQGNGKNKKIKRNYLDEGNAILDAVELGWGRSIQPRHLIQSRNNLRIVPGFKAIKVPIYLNYYKQPYYLKIHELVRESIQIGFQRELGL
ncbi:MAG: LysR family transcriptional regulator [Bdellovibrio sp.]